MTRRHDRALGWAVFWAASVALAALSTALGTPVIVLVAAPLLALASRRIGDPSRYAVSRTTLTLLASVVFSALLIGLAYRPARFIEIFSLGLGCLILVKQFDQTTPRDRALVFSMSSSLMVGSALMHSSALIGVLLAVYLVVALRAAAVLQIALVEHRAGAPLALARWGLVRRGAVLSGAATVAVTVAVFILMPRGLMAAPQALAGNSAAQGDESGFDPEIQLESSGTITKSFDPVFEVSVADGPVAPGASEALYLRGAVIDEYIDGVWRPSSSRGWLPVALQNGRAEFSAGGASSRTLAVRAIGTERPEWVFSEGRPVSVDVGDEDVSIRRDPTTGEVLFERGAYRGYTVTSEPPGLARADPPRQPLAFQSGPIREYAESLMLDRGLTRDVTAHHTPADERIVRMFEAYLRSTYAYTLDRPAVAPGEDPIEAFLISNRRGHCEYFASALAALARSVGIDARVVTGYLTSEREADGAYIVRNAHAHAWVEALVEPGLWLRFDASPPASVAEAHRAPSGVLVAIRSGWGWVNDLWVRSVVSYDGRMQANLLGEAFQDAASRARAQGTTLGAVGGLGGVFRAASLAAGAFVGVLAIGMLVPAARDRSRGRLRGRGPGVLPMVRRADRVLRRVGLARGEGVTLRAHAREIGRVSAPAAGAYDELARLHYACRYGDAPCEGAPARAAELVHRLRHELRERPV